MPASTRASLAAIAVLICALPVRASHLDGYVFTFETPPDPLVWSHTTTTAFLDGGRRLGPFITETVTLAGMDYLGFPATLTRKGYLAFDIILSGAWAGDSGNDHFIVVANGQTVLDETFSNIVANTQSYPVPGSPGRTGSQSVPISVSGNGFRYSFSFEFALNFAFPGCCTDVGVSFRGTGANWYLDNVVVSSTPIPEPHTALLTATGLVALGARRRARADA